MFASWLNWTCCGFCPCERSAPTDYSRLQAAATECPPRWQHEIINGLPPGVSVADLFQSQTNQATLSQAYKLAVQSSAITDFLQRFDSATVPVGCQATVRAQVTKLQSLRNVIWNTMIAIAAGTVTVEDATLKTLLQKQAGETLSLVEMERLAAAIAGDSTVSWAQEIDNVICNPPNPVEDPVYDDPYESEEESEVLALCKNAAPKETELA